MQMRIAAVDLVSNTCFPALAAEELGFYKADGLDAHIELVPALGATKALRDGTAVAMIAGSVHDVLTEKGRSCSCAFPRGPLGCSLSGPISPQSAATFAR